MSVHLKFIDNYEGMPHGDEVKTAIVTIQSSYTDQNTTEFMNLNNAFKVSHAAIKNFEEYEEDVRSLIMIMRDRVQVWVDDYSNLSKDSYRRKIVEQAKAYFIDQLGVQRVKSDPIPIPTSDLSIPPLSSDDFHKIGTPFSPSAFQTNPDYWLLPNDDGTPRIASGSSFKRTFHGYKTDKKITNGWDDDQ